MLHRGPRYVYGQGARARLQLRAHHLRVRRDSRASYGLRVAVSLPRANRHRLCSARSFCLPYLRRLHVHGAKTEVIMATTRKRKRVQAPSLEKDRAIAFYELTRNPMTRIRDLLMVAGPHKVVITIEACRPAAKRKKDHHAPVPR